MAGISARIPEKVGESPLGNGNGSEWALHLTTAFLNSTFPVKDCKYQRHEKSVQSTTIKKDQSQRKGRSRYSSIMVATAKKMRKNMKRFSVWSFSGLWTGLLS